MAQSDTQTKELTPAQIKAIDAIMACRDVRAAAKQCGTPERTIWRWLSQEHVKSALVEAEAHLIDYGMRRLLHLQEKAIDTLEAVIDNQAAPASIRVRAALGVLDMSVKLRELRDLDIRLAALEAALLAK